MAEITIVKPHDEGKSALEVTVNGEKWSLTRGETVDVPEYIAAEVRRSLAQRDSLSLSDRDEREDTGEGGGGGGGGSNVETATIEITVTDSTATITSGEFPEWCTPANIEYIYGNMSVYCLDDEGDTNDYTAKAAGINAIGEDSWVLNGYYYDTANESSHNPYILNDLSMAGDNMSQRNFTDGTITITLIYMPEE